MNTRWPRRLADLAMLAAVAVLLMAITGWIAAPATSLASDSTPSPLPPGDVDGDADDWAGAPWMVAAILAVAVVAAGVIIARLRTHRSRREDDMT